MRQKCLTIALFALPLASGLSLTNFQEITSSLIPIPCSLAYSSEIPTCTVDDFNKGCSKKCKKALRQKASQIIDTCAGLVVNSRSLLGIVQAGGIIDALCLKDPEDITPTTARTTTPIQTTRPSPPQTTTQTSRQIPPSTTPLSTPDQSSTLQTSTILIPSTAITTGNNVAPTTTNPPPAAGLGGDFSSTSRLVTPTTTARGGASEDNGSGGGSPFDIVSGGNCLERSSIVSGLVLAGWVVLLLGR